MPAQESVDSRYPSAIVTSSLVPSARTPIITSRHTLSCSKRTLTWMPSTHTYTKSTSASERASKPFASSCHWLVSRVTTEAESPDPVPRNCSNAGVKSPDESPCRYSSGSTSTTLGDLRAHAGRIAEANRRRSPVASSTRLSLTRG